MARQFRAEELSSGCAAQVPVPGDFPRIAGNSTARSVLIVDDEPLIRWSLAETLASTGYEVFEAGDARSALETARGALRPIGVVLLDFRLPDSNDLSLLARLRGLLPDSRIIMMTAFGTPEMAEAARQLGAYDVVSKPFEMNELASLVQAASAAPC
jgi:DNA-binding NtrC family response regulator